MIMKKDKIGNEHVISKSGTSSKEDRGGNRDV